jgi:hypothetical protein
MFMQALFVIKESVYSIFHSIWMMQMASALYFYLFVIKKGNATLIIIIWQQSYYNNES